MRRITALTFALLLLPLSGCLGATGEPDGLHGADAEADAARTPQAERSRVVVAIVEFGGTNPYHVDFREPDQRAHPSTYITGYPEDAEPLRLSLGANRTESAEADAGVWANVTSGRLYYVPGTNVVGMVNFGDGLTGLDEGGHSTGTTSLATGNLHGMAPDADLVVINGDLFAGLAWAAEQEWIDVVSISLGGFLGACAVVGETCNPVVDPCVGNPFLPVSLVRSTRRIDARGGEVFGAAGYGCGTTVLGTFHKYPGTSITSFFSGPSWVVTVGTYHPAQEQAEYEEAYPVDLLSPASGYTAADVHSTDGEVAFGNASGAVPRAAGVYAALLLYARELLGDTTEAHPGTTLAQAPPGHALPTSGPLADGVLTQAELEAVYYHTAVPVDVVESYQAHGDDLEAWLDDLMPAVPEAEFLSQGYGLLNESARERGFAVLRGDAPDPLRLREDGWKLATDLVRDGLWVPIDEVGVYPI